VYLLGDNHPYGIVTVISNRLHCLLCRKECRHTAYIRTCLEFDEPPEVLGTIITTLNAPTRSPKSVSPVGISWKKNAFELPEHIKRVLRDGVLVSFQSNSEGEIIIPFEVGTTSCVSCKSNLCFEDVKLPLVTEQRKFTSIGGGIYCTVYYFTLID